MKKKLSIIFCAIIASFTVFAANHVVNTQGMAFAPSSLTINVGDSVTFNNTGGNHNVNGTLSTFPSNPQGFGNGSPSNNIWSYTYIFTNAGTYNYQCDPHASMGMTGVITVNQSTDCSGVVNGTALVDSCGTCHQAYIYDFILHTVNFVDDANSLVAGIDYDPSSEIVVFPDDPANPYWNDCPANTIYDIVSNSTDHTTLKTAIDACALDGVLSGSGPMTLFAPTDAAFNLLPAGTVTALLNDIPQLTDILKHHVVGDSVMSSMLSNGQIVTTLLGTNVTVTINSSGVYIDNAMVTVADIVADNGVVHVIDAVLLPNSTSVSEDFMNADSETYMYSINVLGKKVDKNTTDQIVFDIYKDGSFVKRFNQQ